MSRTSGTVGLRPPLLSDAVRSQLAASKLATPDGPPEFKLEVPQDSTEFSSPPLPIAKYEEQKVRDSLEIKALKGYIAQIPWYKKLVFFAGTYANKRAERSQLKKVLKDNMRKLELYKELRDSKLHLTHSEHMLAVDLIEEMAPERRPASVVDAIKRARAGEVVLKDILNKEYDREISLAPKDHLDAIVNLQWALYKRAVAKGDRFLGGNIILDDGDKRIFQFMERYPKRYKRWLSSHFKGAQDKAMMNRGIDAPKNSLPGNKKHILFGGLKDGNTFTKWEDYGTRGMDLPDHLVNYIKTRGKQDTAGRRRENTPQSIKDMFAAMIQQQGVQLSNEQKKNVKVWGIQAMLAIAGHYGFLTEFDTELRTIEHGRFKDYDHLHMRKGHEAIQSREDLESQDRYTE